MDIIYQIRHSQNVLDIPNTEYVPMKGDVLLSSDGKYYEVISRFYSVTGDFLSVIVSPIVI